MSNEETGKWFKAQFQGSPSEELSDEELAEKREAWQELLERPSVEIPEQLYTVTTFVPVPNKNGLIEIAFGFATEELLKEFLVAAKHAFGYVDIHPLNKGELN